MIDNTPPVIPKESASWKGTILSITVHVLLFGAIWVAMRHGSGNQPAKVDSQSGTQSQAAAAATPVASSAIPPEIKPMVKSGKTDAAVTDTTTAPSKSEIAPSEANAAAKPIPQQARLSEPKHPIQKQSVASIEKNKSIEEKKKKRRSELAIAKLSAKQKSEALAQKMKQKKKSEEAELLAKKHAEERAIKVAAESQKRKELEDQRTLEKLHQEEMQRIKNGLAGNG